MKKVLLVVIVLLIFNSESNVVIVFCHALCLSEFRLAANLGHFVLVC